MMHGVQQRQTSFDREAMSEAGVSDVYRSLTHKQTQHTTESYREELGISQIQIFSHVTCMKTRTE